MAEDSAAYWKQKAEEYKCSWQDAKAELEEYQSSSQELEAELEAQLEQAEGKNRELIQDRERLGVEVDSLRKKLEQQHSSSQKLINSLQDELAEVRGYRDTLERYVRELEQTNDDLERAKRETISSLQDFEARMNQSIERNAFLESELDEKDVLMETIQRLKDEARDLRQEVDIRSKKRTDDVKPKTEAVVQTIPTPMEELIHGSTSTTPAISETPTTPTSSRAGLPGSLPSTPGGSFTGSGTPLSPSARISALNIVGDLLNKVGALEHKLSLCRNFVKENHNQQHGNSAAKVGPPNTARKTPSQGRLKITV